MAGRERPGASGARADLFAARPWVLTPSDSTNVVSMARATALVELCGADLFVLTAQRHDEAVALVSHVPQIVATLAAARLREASNELVSLAGQGIRDVTRIAASDARLWTEILDANAPVVLNVLDALALDLDRTRLALRRLAEKSTDRHDDSSMIASDARAELTALLVEGNQGRARIPGKHGGARTDYVAVPVVIPDQPGSLASLFVAAGEAGVNVEDVSIEHSPGQRVGLVELLVQPESAARLADALRGSGWTVHYEKAR
jgi:prephenate dehydrogenase